MTLPDLVGEIASGPSNTTATDELVVDALLHLGIMRYNESNFLELCDEWSSDGPVQYLISEISKFVVV